jgi:hypothetical protein
MNNVLSFIKTRSIVALLSCGLMAGWGIVTLAPVGTAVAAGSSYPFAKWFITLSFPNDQPLVELTTEIWHHNPDTGTTSLVTTQTDELDCTVSGTLAISNEVATFDGQTYITCEQPDMVQKIDEVSDGNLLVPAVVAVRDAWVRGQVMLASNAPLNTALPVHYQPDIQHALAQTGAGDTVQFLRVDGVQAQSNGYAQAFPYQIGARFQSRAEACEPWKPYDTRFRANGVAAAGTPAVIGQVLNINLRATDIYFGYSPDSNSYFEGSVKTLIVDPGACGRGLG